MAGAQRERTLVPITKGGRVFQGSRRSRYVPFRWAETNKLCGVVS
jgi:hypothetical protein